MPRVNMTTAAVARAQPSNVTKKDPKARLSKCILSLVTPDWRHCTYEAKAVRVSKVDFSRRLYATDKINRDSDTL